MFGDHHALWIDPLDPKRLLSGTDGGFFISHDYGRNWDFVNNMPMAQAYHLGVDMSEPYNVMGGFQDHEIWRGPNEKWNQVGVREGDWLRLRYMADGMHTIADPRDPNIIYYNGHFGDITRLDMRNREERYIQPYPPGPIGGGADARRVPLQLELAGPHVADQPGRPLLTAATCCSRRPTAASTGRSSAPICRPTTSRSRWRAAARSPTTTRGPSSTARSSRSPRARAMRTSSGPGTDDGNVQVTRDGGKTWTNVAPNITGAPKILLGVVDLGVQDRRRHGLHLDRSTSPRRLRAVRVRDHRFRQDVAAASRTDSPATSTS